MDAYGLGRWVGCANRWVGLMDGCIDRWVCGHEGPMIVFVCVMVCLYTYISLCHDNDHCRYWCK